MSETKELSPDRRNDLVALLQQRGELLALPEELITNAMVRCVPRGEGMAPITTPGSGRLPVSTQVATAPTEMGDVEDDSLPPSTEESISSRIVRSNIRPGTSERLKTGSSARRKTTTSVRKSVPKTSRIGQSSSELAPVSVDGSGNDVGAANNDAVGALTPGALKQISDPDDDGSQDLLEDGSIIAGYRIESPLGAGAMGQVYKAMQMSMNRLVAFKVLAPKLANNRKFRERFLREARAAGRLHHPNLIAVHDVGEADGLMFFSMELVDGNTVSDLIQKHGRLPEMRALEICRQTLEALKFAHAAGVVHRDIKPDNIMVTKAGMVKVADLGLARADELEGSVSVTATNTGAVMGTPHYMAPEQGRDAHRVDHRADLYAVGATLYHIVCGNPPFTGSSAMEVLVRAVNNPLKFPEPGPTPAMRVLISRLMEKDAAQRPQSASEALEMLSKIRRKQVDEDPANAGDAAVAVQRARARRMRRTARRVSFYAFAVTIAIVVILFIVGVTGGWQWHSMINEAKGLAEQDKYAEAVALLDRQNTTWASRKLELDRVRSEITNAWDSWAYNIAQKPMREFQDYMRKHDLKNAYTTLQNIGIDLRSARVQKDIDQFQRQWEDAMLTDEGAKNATALEEELVRELWPQEYINHLGHDLLLAFQYNPKTNAVLHENTLRFTAKGSAILDERPKILDGRSMRCAVKFVDKNHNDDHWDLIFSDGRRLVITREGMRVTGTGGDDIELSKSSGQYLFSIRVDRKATEIQLNDAGGWVPIAPITERLKLEWDIGGSRAIDLRVRVVPHGRQRNSGNKK